MGNMGAWLAANWFTILSAVGIVGSLVFTAHSLRVETRTKRIANLLTITTNHREIWKEFVHRPELSRVLNASADLRKRAVTPPEEEFVNFVILHMSSVYYAMRDEMVIKLTGLRRDVKHFLSLPIPKAVWEKTKFFQNDDFVAFVEECRRGGQPF